MASSGHMSAANRICSPSETLRNFIVIPSHSAGDRSTSSITAFNRVSLLRLSSRGVGIQRSDQVNERLRVISILDVFMPVRIANILGLELMLPGRVSVEQVTVVDETSTPGYEPGLQVRKRCAPHCPLLPGYSVTALVHTLVPIIGHCSCLVRDRISPDQCHRRRRASCPSFS